MPLCMCGDDYREDTDDGKSISENGYCLTCLGIDNFLTLKRNLCVKLKMQKEIMEENAKLMKEVYPNGNHLELIGAAKITQHWIDAIEQETGVKGGFIYD